MKPITVTIDVSKINKDKIITKTFTNKEGQEVTQKLYKIEVVPLKEKKIIKEGSYNGKDWTMLKTHFAKEFQTKEETKKLPKGMKIVNKALGGRLY